MFLLYLCYGRYPTIPHNFLKNIVIVIVIVIVIGIVIEVKYFQNTCDTHRV